MAIYPTRDLLSISSHVVHGKVGNDAIQFPLNIRHWNVDCIHTTNLSNHPGYKKFKGTKSSFQLIQDLYKGLTKIELRYDAAIVGYVASKQVLEVIYTEILAKLPKETIVVMDPIMGDNGKLYVEEALVPLYKHILRDQTCEGLINLVTPNQFEMEILTDVKIVDLDSLKQAIVSFFELYRVQKVVITSVSFDDSDTVLCIGAGSDGEVFTIQGSRIDAVFSGSGDLFLGILTDRFVKSHGDLKESLTHTMNVVHKVLENTCQLSANLQPKRYVGDKLYIPDLRLVESKFFLRDDSSDGILDNLTTSTTFL
ncbi:hypothetical protein FOA43_003594 [Brettanomyces nanus]|uniref:pyridoxal kinase n=1 Tax=Eeniella nana TaxID=13502 RepID=A0A875S5G7_EENNA|nr:uncharacterized protein FOA43_003594 [Brettanomyces nanus]QPG76208.1 hypothetical protein FOA43_003594 [Brettanomyces nanus]